MSQVRPTLEQFQAQLNNNSINRVNTNLAGRAGASAGCKRLSDNKWVLEELCQHFNIANARNLDKNDKIRAIVNAERTVRHYTAEPTPAAAGTPAPGAPGTPCATINAPEGLRVVKSVTGAATGFQPYGIRFTISTEAVHNAFKAKLVRAQGYQRENNFIVNPLLVALDQNCAGVAATAPRRASTSQGLVVEKISLAPVGFQPYTLEFQITSAALDTKFRGVMQATKNFCGEADLLRNPILEVLK